MTRNAASAKRAGRGMNQLVADYLARELGDDRIEQRKLSGALDRGDVGGVRVNGQKVVVEVKDYGGRFEVGSWLGEAETERINDSAGVGLVVAKRRGKGDPGDQVVMMTLRDLVSLIKGERPE